MKLERQVRISYGVGTSAYRRRSARILAQVTLWRTTLIVGAVFGLALAVQTVEMRTACGCQSKTQIARIKVMKFAYEAFPSWAATTNHVACPASLHDLVEYMNDPSKEATHDPWGTELEMKCGPEPGGWIRGMYVRSAGPDTRFDTADDISSND